MNTRLKILSQLSLMEATQLVARRALRKTSRNGIPFDEFVAADTFRYVLEDGGSCKRFKGVSEISLHSYEKRQTVVFKLRRQTTDFHVFNQVFRNKEYQVAIDICNRKGLTGSLNIIDAGSNVGCSPIWWLCYFPNSKVVAIEPEFQNYFQMKQNIELNKCSQHIVPLRNALWSTDETLYINQNFRDRREYAFSVENYSENSLDQEIKGITLQKIKEKFMMPHVDILKIDIEGSERYLLEDLEMARKNLSGVEILALEIHDDVANRQKIESNLIHLGYSFQSANETLFAYLL